jgi:hypothetical protein
LSLLLSLSPLLATAAPLSVNLTTREQSRQFYRTVYFASEGVPLGFTGDVAALRPGDTSAAFKESVRLRVNFLRAFAGLSGEVQFASNLSAKCQQAALLGALNNSISHFPAPSLRGYTAEAAEAAAKSNLALANNGPAAILGYLRDSGANNRDVGHRRWLFYPQTRQMGTGDMPATVSTGATNALWILDEANVGGSRPATRDNFVAWPPPGYVPHTLVFPRWSLSVPGADFSQAFVAVRRNGTAVPVAVSSVNSGYGENTIVWSIDNQDPSAITRHDRPTSDIAYAVEVTNVIAAGAVQNYRYTVTVYDPDTPGAGAAAVAVSGPTTTAVGQAASYSVTSAPYFSKTQWRSVRFTAGTPRFDAEGGAGLAGIAANIGDYNPVATDLRGAGAAGFHLLHPAPVQLEQTLTLPDLYYAADRTATLTFLSRLGYATREQVARVQISTDDGVSWSDAYEQAGTGGSGEGSFQTRTLSLAAYEKRAFRVRFNYTFLNSGAFFNQTDTGVGWYFDDIVLNGVAKVTASAASDVAGGSFSFTPGAAGETGLQVRGLIDAYPAEWSSTLVTVAPGSPGGGTTDPGNGGTPPPAGSSARLINLSVRTTAGRDAAALVVGFSLSGSSAKPILLRAIGPTLGVFGVPGALADPVLTLRDAAGATVLENDNWGGAAAVSAAAARLGAFALDAAARDSAALPNISPASYTVSVTPAGASVPPGVALVELYDADPATGSRLTNVSARARVGTGTDILVVGFAVGGTGQRNVLVRAIGPALSAFGLPGALANPKLEIFQNGTLIQSNDDWSAALAATFASVGAFPLTTGSADAALALSLGPGTYTAQVSGVGNTEGVALVELYELP